MGITGQDGACLAAFLVNKAYLVHGIKRRSSLFNTERVDHLYQDTTTTIGVSFCITVTITDGSNLARIVRETQPDEIYILGAQSHVAVFFESLEYAADVDGLGALRLLEAVRILGMEKKTRFYQASTSELFGQVLEVPQKETTPFTRAQPTPRDVCYPENPWGLSRIYSGSQDCL